MPVGRVPPCVYTASTRLIRLDPPSFTGWRDRERGALGSRDRWFPSAASMRRTGDRMAAQDFLRTQGLVLAILATT